MEDAKVLISIPTRGEMQAATTAWLLRNLAANIAVDLVITPHPLEFARNQQVWRFLESDCTHLFTLDADCIPPERCVQKLLAYDLPVVVAPHASVINGETGIVALDRVKGGYRQHRPMEGLQRCDVVGGSGLLVRRDVLETLGPPWFHFEMNEHGLMERGEDFYFSERLTAAGYDIWVDFDLTARHRVGVVV